MQNTSLTFASSGAPDAKFSINFQTPRNPLINVSVCSLAVRCALADGWFEWIAVIFGVQVHTGRIGENNSIQVQFCSRSRIVPTASSPSLSHPSPPPSPADCQKVTPRDMMK
jgi:hypothetical protein